MLEKFSPTLTAIYTLRETIRSLERQVMALEATLPEEKNKRKYPPGKQPVRNPVTGKIKYI